MPRPKLFMTPRVRKMFSLSKSAVDQLQIMRLVFMEELVALGQEREDVGVTETITVTKV